MTAPQLARIELYYETEPSGYRAHWTLDEIRPGRIPSLSIRGPLDEPLLLTIEYRPMDEGAVHLTLEITEERVDGDDIQTITLLEPEFFVNWGDEARLVTGERSRVRRFGRNRWQELQTDIRITAHPMIVEPNME